LALPDQLPRLQTKSPEREKFPFHPEALSCRVTGFVSDQSKS